MNDLEQNVYNMNSSVESGRGRTEAICTLGAIAGLGLFIAPYKDSIGEFASNNPITTASIVAALGLGVGLAIRKILRRE
jgi:hypothetical protein